MTRLSDLIVYEQYRGHILRSHPLQCDDKWKIRINVTYPTQGNSQEYLDGERVFGSLPDAHWASFEYGRSIIEAHRTQLQLVL